MRPDSSPGASTDAFQSRHVRRHKPPSSASWARRHSPGRATPAATPSLLVGRELGTQGRMPAPVSQPNTGPQKRPRAASPVDVRAQSENKPTNATAASKDLEASTSAALSSEDRIAQDRILQVKAALQHATDPDAKGNASGRDAVQQARGGSEPNGTRCTHRCLPVQALPDGAWTIVLPKALCPKRPAEHRSHRWTEPERSRTRSAGTARRPGPGAVTHSSKSRRESSSPVDHRTP